MIDKLFLLINVNQRSLREKLIITQIYARSLCNHKEYNRAFNLIQIEYAKHPSFGKSLLYLYSKLVIKNKQLEFYASA